MNEKVRRIEKNKQIIPFKRSSVNCVTITKSIQVKILGTWFTMKTYEIERWIDIENK